MRAVRPDHGLAVDGALCGVETVDAANAVIGRWQMSGDVEVDGSPIGRIRGRRVAGGRFEMGLVSVDGEAITPDIAFLPADRPVEIWFRSSEIEVPAVMLMDSVDPASG